MICGGGVSRSGSIACGSASRLVLGGGGLRGFALLAALLALALALGEHFRLAGGGLAGLAAAFPPVVEFHPAEPETGLGETHRLLAGEQDHRHQIGALRSTIKRARATDQVHQDETAHAVADHAARAVEIAASCAHSLKKKSAACSQAAPASSRMLNPITARGQIRPSKASLTMPNQMKPTGTR